MLYPQTRKYIAGLSDSELVAYVLTGRRMYDPDAVAFAREELARRDIPQETLAELREPVAAELAVADLSQPPRRSILTEGFLCENCGREAPTQYVEYAQNIGALFARWGSCHRGSFCSNCNRRVFWTTTLVTLLFGWWGLISFVVAPAYIIANVIMYLRTRSLPPVPEGATAPRIEAEDLDRISAHAALIDRRIADGVDLSDIACELAPQVGLRPAQTWLGIREVLAQRTRSLPVANELSQGFPVILKHDQGR